MDAIRSSGMIARLRVACFVLPFIGAACAANGGDVESLDHHDDDGSQHESENLGSVSSALVATDSVNTAVSQGCSTVMVKGLSTQLVEEINCMKPGSMKRIDGVSGLALGSAVFPYLQSPAATALIAAQKVRGVTMSLNSGLRTLPQQYLLYRWWQAGKCGIAKAAKPGTSNHESGIAVDINDNASWRSAMASKNYRWLGSSDPVHFDYVGGGTVNMKGLSVQAFQRLWNRNHPTDKITEDGVYGPATESRLSRSPVGGFAVGASCSMKMSIPSDGDPLPEGVGGEDPPPAIPDAEEPADDAAKNTQSAPLPGSSDSTDPQAPASSAQGCSTTSNAPAAPSSFAVFGLALAALAAARRRR
jgi:MYXO-CTERM domain-containing protein